LGQQVQALLLDAALGTRSKRDWELAVVHAALNAGALAEKVATLSTQLRISQRKAQALLDEIELRTACRTPAELDEQLRAEVIEPYVKMRRLSIARDTGRIELHIDRLVLRERFRQLVREEFGSIERGLDGTLLSVQPEVFVLVVLTLAKVSESDLRAQLCPAAKSDGAGKSPGRLFAEEFAKSAGKSAGSKAVEWAERLLTGGWSDAMAIVNALKPSNASDKLLK
jgi:hypothetical protein